MTKEFNHLDGEERIEAENNYLKMKLMLEHGAQFMGGEEPIPGEVENEFLNNILAFEKQFENRKTIKVFEKLGQPGNFKPVSELGDDEIENAWETLKACLNEHDIDMGVCSPNVSKRELYRFVTEELFSYELDDIDLPGWVTHFIYDEFHPDPVFDNSRMVREELLKDIFQINELFYEINYDAPGFSFNDDFYAEFPPFKEKIDRFKSLYAAIELNCCEVHSCNITGDHCEVTGTYKATARTDKDEQCFAGNFHVELRYRESCYWYFSKIALQGFNP